MKLVLTDLEDSGRSEDHTAYGTAVVLHSITAAAKCYSKRG